MERIVEQVAAAGIRISDLARLEVPVPPLRTQHAIAEVLGALDDKIAANRRLARISESLAAELVRGAVAVSHSESKLGDVSEMVIRGSAPKYVEDGNGVLVLNQKCIRDTRVDLGPARWTDASKVKSDRLLKSNDVLVNSTGAGTLGRVGRWVHNVQATVDSHVTIVRFDSMKIDPVCAGFALLQAQSIIEMMGEGSTGQTELSREHLRNMNLRFVDRGHEPELSGRLTELSDLVRHSLVECETLASIRDTLLPRLMSGELRVRDAEEVVSNAV